MNTLTKGFAKRVLSMLLVTIMVFSLGIVGITSASAANVELAETGYNHTGGYIYLDNSKTNWSSDKHVYFVVCTDNSGTGYRMSKLPYSNYFYVDFNSILNGSSWNNATYFTIMMADSSWGDPASCGTYDNMKQYALVLGTYSNWTFEENKTYEITPSSSSEGSSISVTYHSDGYSFMHTTDYAYAYGSTDGVSYSADASAGTVSISGYYMNGNGTQYSRSASSTLGTTSSASTYFAKTSTATVKAVPATGYDFVGWFSSTTATTAVSTSETYTYTVGSSSTKLYARFQKSVSITDATITSAPNSAVIGSPVDITLDYAVSGSENTPTYELLLNGEEYTGDYTPDVANKTITVASPKLASTYNFSVKITVDGVSVTTDSVAITYRDELAATLSANATTGYVGDNFTLTVTDNSAQYDGTATYTLYDASTGQEAGLSNETGEFTLGIDVSATFSYYVVVTVGDKSATTNTVTITVKEKVFSVTLDAPETAMEDREFTVTANVMFAPEGETLTYTLVGSDGKTFTSTDGVFTVVSNDPADVTYTVTVTASGGASVTDTATVTITVDLGTYPVKIFFKCSDTFGYLPNAKVDGTVVELTKSTAIITQNASDTASYSWYSYTSAADVEFGADIVFTVHANRNYFYNVSYTVSAGEGDYVMGDDGYYYYYLALENLNGGTNTLTNISNQTEAERNWVESAVNMIYDEADAIAPVAVNYSYANYGDANCDGKINIKDATYIQKSLAKVVEASELSTIVSDVNQDGSVTIKDATAIQKQLANL